MGFNHVTYVSTHPSREYGITAFTKDLIDFVNELYQFSPLVVAVDQKEAFYDYGRKVKIKINLKNKETYVQTAEYINSSNINIVNLYEFVLFGGIRKNMEQRTYNFGLRFLWANVSQEYANFFNRIIEGE